MKTTRSKWQTWLMGAALISLLSGCVYYEDEGVGVVRYGPDRPYPEGYAGSYWPYYDGNWGYRRPRYYHSRAEWRPNGYYRVRGADVHVDHFAGRR